MNEHGVLGEQTIARAKMAAQLAKEHNCALLLTSGWAYRDDSALEIGTCVRNYIRQNFKLSHCTVLSDTNSRDTVGDAYYLRVRLQEFPVNKLIVVTSDYHVNRTRIIFNSFFTPDVAVDVRGALSTDCNNVSLIAHEQSSIDAFYLTFKSVNFTDDVQVLAALNTLHPFYNGEIYPKVT